MNTYRVEILLLHWNERRAYNVDAATPGEAIRRALAAFPASRSVEAKCQLVEAKITRDWSDKRVRAA